MAFCSTSGQFAAGWLGGGNRHRFETMATTDTTPVGILALVAQEPVGWCACGPRSRYTVAIKGRSKIISGRPRAEDDSVWLLPCLMVHASHRGQGITRALIRGAVDVAGREGASAIEGWPVTGVGRQSAAFVGREKVFEELGFGCVDRPSPHRAIMRLELRPAGAGPWRT